MLLPFLPRDEAERGVMLRSIGPVWDGNEVWLVVAGAATFAAFPAWYATMFSGFYIALLLVLFFLIVRVVSFEWRRRARARAGAPSGSGQTPVGSYGASLIWGVALANLLYGVPLDAERRLHRDVLGSLQSVHRPRRYCLRAPVRLSRRDLPDPADDGRRSSTVRAARRALCRIPAVVFGAASWRRRSVSRRIGTTRISFRRSSRRQPGSPRSCSGPSSSTPAAAGRSR